MPVAQRNAAITAIAKAAFQREMPEVYREYGTPTIEQKIVTHNPQSYEASRYGEEYGDMFYMVTFCSVLNDEKMKGDRIGRPSLYNKV